MSRELKFRANNRIGDFLYSSEFYSLSEYFEECDMHGWENQEQYTGLLDKNGVEIYEGDVVDYGYYEDDQENDDLSRPMHFIVKWSGNDCGFIANGRLITGTDNVYPRAITGNIHEI